MYADHVYFFVQYIATNIIVEVTCNCYIMLLRCMAILLLIKVKQSLYTPWRRLRGEEV
jgi:hypothetical protein